MKYTVRYLNNRRQEDKTHPVWGLVQRQEGGYKERVSEGEYDENIMHLCMKMEK
jgi:hypothetical protein